MKKFIKYIVLLVLFSMCLQPIQVNAADINEIDILMKDTQTKEIVPDVTLSIYKITDGDVGAFKISSEYEGSEVKIDDLYKNVSIEKFIEKIEKKILNKNLQPYETKTSDKSGKIDFKNLSDGIYLIRQNLESLNDDIQYITTSFIVSVPSIDSKGQYIRHIQCLPKGCMKDVVKTSMVVNKIWKDTNYSQTRPKSIIVGLYRNNVIYEKVVLNAENSWYYEWENLEDGVEWTVKELDVPDGYVSTQKTEDGVCMITNTKTTPPPPTNQKLKTGDQTNIIAWVMTLMMSTGMICLIVYFKNRKKGKEL